MQIPKSLPGIASLTTGLHNLMQKQAFIKSYRKEALSKSKNKSKSDRKAVLGDSEIKKAQ